MRTIARGFCLQGCLWLASLMVLVKVNAFSNLQQRSYKASTIRSRNEIIEQNQYPHITSPAPKLSSVALRMARVPEIDDWTILRNGAVRGTVQKHPEIEDGDTITTSSLAAPDECSENLVVATTSGSKYKLLSAAPLQKKILKKNMEKMRKLEEKNKLNEERKAQQLLKKDSKVEKKNGVQQKAPVKAAIPKPKPVKAVVEPPKQELALPLSGKSIGNGQYLLVGKAIRTTSGKSQLWSAYKADPNGDPIIQNIGNNIPAIKVKVSSNTAALLRENGNYDRITTGIFSGKFVQKLDFFPIAQGKGFESCSALVIESGNEDLKELLAKNGNIGFKGKYMRELACDVGRCVQAMHASNLVWTDLKTENFVITNNGMRGIDLESAVKIGANPVDYSPEACPPEFATAFMKGDGAEFIVDPSYDMWSLGMLLYEMSTGTAYFAGKSATLITKTLRNDAFEADVSAVEDDNLRDLVSSCLSKDPKKRPDITQFLLHPYFITTGIGPFSFFWLD